MGKPIRVTAIVQDIEFGLFYQRLRIPFKRMDPTRFFYQFQSIKENWYHRDRETDVYVFCHPTSFAHLDIVYNLKKMGKKIICDIDDLLTELPSDHPEIAELQEAKDALPRILLECDAVVTSTEYLKLKYSYLNKNIHVIENHWDTEYIPENYTPKYKTYHTCFTLGWIGGRTHLADQYVMLEGLMAFMEKYEDTRCHFKVLCPPALIKKFGARIFYDPQVVHHFDYHAWLSTVPWDVCLVPLCDNTFNDAKSDLRLVDMAIHEIPCIASPRADFRRHEPNGLLLCAGDSPEEWYEALEYAYTNAEETRRIGKTARAWVLENRRDTRAAMLWQNVIESVVKP